MAGPERIEPAIAIGCLVPRPFIHRLSSACIAFSTTRGNTPARDTISHPCWGWLGLGPRLAIGQPGMHLLAVIPIHYVVQKYVRLMVKEKESCLVSTVPTDGDATEGLLDAHG